MAEALTFDATSHTYRIGGRLLPSVTTILKRLQDFSGIPAAVLEQARERGERLHKAVNLFNRNDLDWDSLDPEIRSLTEAWAQYLSDTGAVVIASEQPVWHPKFKYAGTPDVVLELGGRIIVPDLKATWAVPRTVGLQTAAYAEALWELAGGRGRKPERSCIHLKDGKYNVVPRNDPADWAVFFSALNLYRWEQLAA
jgi:hypothetical protein